MWWEKRKERSMPSSDARLEEDDHLEAVRKAVVAAALPHVAFDGWTDRTLSYAVADAGIEAGLARLAFPRGGVDLALAYHYAKDAELAEGLRGEELLGLRFRDRIAHAIAYRFEIIGPDREAVRRGVALFALPNHAADGARAIWRTADVIWTALGDSSTDYNWYTKRTTLAAVYSSCLLYWLGDQSPNFANTRAFIGRRIDNVMAFEAMKARINKNPLAAALAKGPRRVLDRVRAPDDTAPSPLPGRWRRGR